MNGYGCPEQWPLGRAPWMTDGTEALVEASVPAALVEAVRGNGLLPTKVCAQNHCAWSSPGPWSMPGVQLSGQNRGICRPTPQSKAHVGLDLSSTFPGVSVVTEDPTSLLLLVSAA